jgi:phospholipid/cholesterol/gamma-HCH transport system substrate-binding protein
VRLRRHPEPRIRRHRPRVSNFAAGIIGAVLILVACYLVFGGALPFSGSPFVLKAVFTTETQLHIPSEVRISGVKVGEVVSVKRIAGSRQAGLVTMDLQPNALPIHADATINIRPRIFLEGNFYADLTPGSPSAPVLSSGSTLPTAQTSGPVQLDRLLSDLNSNSRTNLQTLLQGLGLALNTAGGSAANATQDPSVRGLTGGQALNLSLKYSVQAFRASAIVNDALLGVQPHDLSGVVRGNEQVLSALAASGSSLPSLVDNFNATMAALASRQADLSATIAALPPWLRATDSALGPLNASFAPTQEFAKALIPGVNQLNETITLALPWLKQSTLLMSPSELGGLLNDLTPAVQNTSASISSTKTLLQQSDLFAQCFTHNVIPTGNEVIQDPPNSTGFQVYQEFFQGAVGLAGAAQNFDGNGRYLRASAGGGSDLVATAPVGSAGPLYGNAVLPPLGTRPAWPGHAPPLNRNVACYKNPAPDLNQVATGGTP